MKVLLDSLNTPYIVIDGNQKGIDELYDVVIAKYKSMVD